MTEAASRVASAWPQATPASLVPPNGRPSISHLQRIARLIRRDIVQMTARAGSGHPGGSLSAVEILVALYFGVMRHDPANPSWPDRDRFILSKAHACPVLYAVLARCGYFPVEELATFRRINSRLQGHAHIMTPGVEFSGGSLGQGLSFGLGCALAGRLDGRSFRVYVLLGDGECDEGQVWEAGMAAAHYKVDTLTAILDRNRIQNDRFTAEAMELEPLADKWRAFGWAVREVDGHDFSALMDALEWARHVQGRPSILIAHTVKGKGVSFMENNPDFHGRAPTPQELARALAELEDPA
ncbi:MAG: transketolase [Dehalococcoidia bacterium]|nr:transketolase [Dehalococcoidia bacterium]MDW8120632.1 transketolase [Chloroflexota bacterium]